MMAKKSQQQKRFAIAYSLFNEVITQRLLEGCVDELHRMGVGDSQIQIVSVPGAFELPLACLKLAQKKSIDAVIALGAVIRGETYHFELVADNAARGILHASLETGKPVIFGVLSTETVGQAQERSEEKGDNKGRDAARAAWDMVMVLEKI